MELTLEERLQACIKKAGDLEAVKNRFVGQLSAAETQLAEVEEECRKRGIDPAKLDAICAQLEQTYHGKVESLESGISRCEEQLAQFRRDTTGGLA